MENPLILKVECYAGYRGEETPRRIWLGEKKIEVVRVIDRWLAPAGSGIWRKTTRWNRWAPFGLAFWQPVV